MTSCVLDASTVLAWLWQEDGGMCVAGLLGRLEREVVPYRQADATETARLVATLKQEAVQPGDLVIVTLPALLAA